MANKNILWEVGCEGHVDAWVVAPNWEQATIEAAKFWGVSWAKVAAYCEKKRKTVGVPGNVCCRCGRVYYAELPLCEACKLVLKSEEKENQRRLVKAYKLGKVM